MNAVTPVGPAEERAHSKYGGSSASRWMKCPGSVALCERMPKLPSSAYAAEGTKAHSLAEEALLIGERDASKFSGLAAVHRVESGPFSAEMCQYVQVYLDAVYAELDQDPDAILLVEKRFTLDVSTTAPGTVFGTNDALIYSPRRKRLAVFDLKYGAGVSVEAEGNAQLLFYAAGAALAADNWPLSEIEVFIVQPRAFDSSDRGAIRSAKIDPLDLLEFHVQVEDAVAAAERAARDRAVQPEDDWSGTHLSPGYHCRWCAAAPTCLATQKKALEMAGLAYATVAEIETPKQLPVVRDFSPEQLGKTLKALDLLDEYAKQVRSFAEQYALAGNPIPGFKLVEKMARAKWSAAENDIAGYVATMYGVDTKDILPPKLVTITEMDRLLADRIKEKKALQSAKEDVKLRFTTKESSGLTLVDASDKREPATVTKAAAFSGVSV